MLAEDPLDEDPQLRPDVVAVRLVVNLIGKPSQAAA